MDLTKINLQAYIDYKLTDLMNINNNLGFRVTLIYGDGSSKVCQHSGYKKKSDALKEREKVISQLYTGAYVAYPNIKVKELLPFWLVHVMCQTPTFKANSYLSYKNCIEKHIIPRIGNLKLLQLNQGHIRELYKELAEKYSSIPKLAKTILNTSMKYALSKRLITTNPCKGINLPRNVKREKYHTISIKETETFTLEQTKKLLIASKKSRIHVQIVLALLMGLRKSEINGLKYSDIDFTRKKLKIHKQLGIDLTLDSDGTPILKTKKDIDVKTPSSDRELDIPDYVFNVLLEERKKYEKNRSRRQHGVYTFHDLDYVCCSSYGNPRSKDYHFPHYKQLLEETGLPHIRFHNLRKTYTTLLMKNDINQKAIARALGHSKSIITIDTYTEKKVIIEDCADLIQPFILEVHPYDEEDQSMLWTMFGEKISITVPSSIQNEEQEESDLQEEQFYEPVVHDYSDIEEVYDIVEWHLGEEWNSL